jgi:hypothetical protein
VAFDVLRDGDEDLRPLPLVARRARPGAHPQEPRSGTLRMSELVPGTRAPSTRASSRRRERASSPSGLQSRRTGRAAQSRLAEDQAAEGAEFMSEGSPTRVARAATSARSCSACRRTMPLEYVGHTGTRSTPRSWTTARLMKPRERRRVRSRRDHARTSDRTGSAPTPPPIVAVRFTELTDEQRLRAPVYVGQRDRGHLSTVGAPRTPRRAGATRLGDSRPARLPSGSPANLGAAGGDRGHRRVAERWRSRRPSSRRQPSRKVWWPAVHITRATSCAYYVTVSPYPLARGGGPAARS